MEDLKVKCGKKDTSMVIGLLIDLGYKTAASDSKMESNFVDGIYAKKGFMYTTVFSPELCREITISELRDMVVLKRNDVDDATHTDGHYSFYVGKDKNYFFSSCDKAWRDTWKNVDILKPIEKPIEKPMKEYLNPNQDYKLVTCKVGYTPIPSNWIEIPEGVLFAYETGSTGLLFTRNKRDAYSGFLVWQRETLNDKVASAETARQADKVLKEILEGELPEFEFEAIDAFIESNVEQDNVNQPSHYKKGTIECIDAIQSSMTHEAFCGYLKGNVQKYMWRYENKGGVESLKKAQWYLNKLIEVQDANSCKD